MWMDVIKLAPKWNIMLPDTGVLVAAFDKMTQESVNKYVGEEMKMKIMMKRIELKLTKARGQEGLEALTAMHITMEVSFQPKKTITATVINGIRINE